MAAWLAGASGALATGSGGGLFWQAVLRTTVDSRLTVSAESFLVLLRTTVFISLQAKNRFLKLKLNDATFQFATKPCKQTAHELFRCKAANADAEKIFTNSDGYAATDIPA
jgi:hypothetical protein